MDLGNIIREGRKQRGLDQTTLAHEIGVSRKWVIDIEKGKPRAELGLVLRTLNALGISLSTRQASDIDDTAWGMNIDQIVRDHKKPADPSEAITSTNLGTAFGLASIKHQSPFEAVQQLAETLRANTPNKRITSAKAKAQATAKNTRKGKRKP
jgi:y4mF family transcriptional regulator